MPAATHAVTVAGATPKISAICSRVKRAFVFMTTAADPYDDLKTGEISRLRAPAPQDAEGNLTPPGSSFEPAAAIESDNKSIRQALASDQFPRLAKALKISYRALLYKIKDMGLKQDAAVS